MLRGKPIGHNRLILSILSKAAAMYTKKIEEGLSGDPKLRLWPG